MSDKTRQNETALTAQQTAALEALMTCATVQDAAEQVGVQRRTLYRWMRQTEFADALRALQTEAMDALRRRLLTASRAALDAVIEVLNDTSASAMVRLKAAQIILEQTRAAVDADVVARLESLEERLNETPSAPTGN